MKRIDRIRNMPIEEMAREVRRIGSYELDYYCKGTCPFADGSGKMPTDDDCEKCCIDWLNEEVEQ